MIKLKGISRGVSGFLGGLIRNKLSLLAFAFICFFVLVAILSSFFLEPELSVDLEKAYSWPSFKHPLGTDHLGRDMLTQVLWGSRDVLVGGVIVATMVILIGAGIGVLAGFIGGVVDGVLMMFTDILIIIPTFPLILILAAIVGKFNAQTVYLIASLTMWMWVARGSRARVKQIKEMDFIEAAKCLGLSRFHLAFREALPNFASYLTIEFVRAVKNSIFILIGFMFLGIAPWSPYNWGVILFRAAFETGSIYIPKGIVHWGGVLVFLFLLQWSLIQFSRYLEEVYSPRVKEYE